MVGRLFSFWDGLFSGAILNFRGVGILSILILSGIMREAGNRVYVYLYVQETKWIQNTNQYLASLDQSSPHQLLYAFSIPQCTVLKNAGLTWSTPVSPKFK